MFLRRFTAKLDEIDKLENERAKNKAKLRQQEAKKAKKNKGSTRGTVAVLNNKTSGKQSEPEATLILYLEGLTRAT